MMNTPSTSEALHTVRRSAALVFVAIGVAACQQPAAAQPPAPKQQPAGTEWVTLSPNPRGSIATGSARSAAVEEPELAPFRSRKDSLEWASARRAATRAESFRIVVSIRDRTLWVIDELGDTLRAADVATAKDDVLEYNGRTWSFKTPRGQRTVRFKQENPVWTPPDWHYAEVARDYDLKMRHVPLRGKVKLSDGAELSVRDSLMGITKPGGTWEALPLDYEVVFDGTLYIPPIGTRNRRIEGQLGKYKLDLGDGYMLHGTPHQHTVGNAVTHGCVRLRDDDIEWLYENVPVGTKVYLY